MAMETTWQMLLIVTVSASLVHEAYPLSSEMQVLLTFKKSLFDPDPAQAALGNWNPTSPNPCRWSGVLCGEEGEVISVSIGAWNLSGQLVPELGRLSSLQYLDVYDNNLTGTIPAELGNLKNLTQLLLYDNKFTGKIPSQLGSLPNLVKANFSNNGDLCWDFWPTPKYEGSYPLCQKK